MKKTILLLPISLLISQKIHSMELAPTFTAEGKPMAKPSLYLDEKAKDEFSKTLTSLLKKFDSDALPPTLETYAHTHIVDAETFWKYNKGRVIGEAKGQRDNVRAVVNRNFVDDQSYLNIKLTNGEILLRANINLGYLNDFKAIIAAEKQLQALQKKQ